MLSQILQHKAVRCTGWAIESTVLLLIVLVASFSSAPATGQTFRRPLDWDSETAATSGAASAKELSRTHLVVAQKLQGGLWELALNRERFGQTHAAEFARAHLQPVSEDRATVIIVTQPESDPKSLAPKLKKSGVAVIRVGRQHIKASVPLPLLPTLAAEWDDINHVRSPIRPHPSVLPKGADGTASLCGDWRRCFTGAGVRIAIIDGGFEGLAEWRSRCETPPVITEFDYVETGIETDGPHGTAVAEIIHDIAPDAELFLMKIGETSDLEAAVEDCKEMGVHVINHSIGWAPVNFFDGATYDSVVPSPVAIADDASKHGILWVNAAGNEQQSHWRGSWFDEDKDDVLDWAAGVELNEIGYVSAGSPVVLHLTWNDWPRTDQDYDLLLLRWTGTAWEVEAESAQVQTGDQPPLESIGVLASNSAYYAAAVTSWSADNTHTFILRSWYQGLAQTSEEGSIACPADAASVLAVGAVNLAEYPGGGIEPFSSRGPTNGFFTGQPVLTKPDVCGPDGTPSSVYGPQAPGFLGTSASAPHVAGAACLALSRFPDFDAVQLRSFLEAQAVDLGDPGKDTVFGYGALALPTLCGGDEGPSAEDCEGNPDGGAPRAIDADGDGIPCPSGRPA